LGRIHDGWVVVTAVRFQTTSPFGRRIFSADERHDGETGLSHENVM